MKMRLLAASAALALAATTANAAVTVVPPNEANNLNGPLSHGQVMLYDFDGFANANVAYSGHVQTDIETPIANSAPPPYNGGVDACCDSGGNHFLADPTDYASVQGGQTATFSALNGYTLRSFSFYMGSPDSYNHLRFNFADGSHQDFNGEAIWGGNPTGNGDRTVGYRVYYNFGGRAVTSINFSSDTNAFEFDSLGGNLAVPEPASWALMIAGFGAAGTMLRRRRAALA